MIWLLALLAQDPAPDVSLPRPERADGPGEKLVLRAEAWYADLDGRFDGGAGRFDDDLELEEPNELWRGRIGYQFPTDSELGLLSLELGYAASRWKGSGTLLEDLSFEEGFFPAGTAIASEFVFQHVELELRAETLPDRDYPWLFGASVAGHFVKGRLTLESAAAHGTRSTADLMLSVGGMARWMPAPWIDVGGDVRFGTGTLDSLLVEARATVRIRWEGVELEAGWRGLHFSEVEHAGGNEIDFWLQGPTIGLTLRL